MKTSRRGQLLVLFIALALVAGVLVVGGLVAHRIIDGPSAKDYVGAGSGRIVVKVTPGQTATDIGDVLAQDGVVASVSAFRKAAEANPNSENIEPGYYAMRARMSAASAVALLLDPTALLQSKVTIPEGTSLKNLLPLLAAHTQVTLASLQAAVKTPAALGLPSYADGNVEGFLFPATYDVPPNTTAVQLLQTLVARFGEAAQDDDLVSGAAALGYTPLQVVIIASIIEGESAAPADAPKVARVFYNRLAAHMPLGSEFTVNYAGGSATSPYNTYTHTGFPPGPYDSPGDAALLAALHPATGSWLYFVTLPRGGTQFVDTGAEFDQLQAECQQEGGCK